MQCTIVVRLLCKFWVFSIIKYNNCTIVLIVVLYCPHIAVKWYKVCLLMQFTICNFVFKTVHNDACHPIIWQMLHRMCFPLTIEGLGPPSKTMLLGLARVLTPNRTSTCSAIFAHRSRVKPHDRQTHRQTVTSTATDYISCTDAAKILC